jgi:hypothetical protein
MRFMLGVAMAAGVIGLGVYAAGEDDYYGDGTTRWGHATKDGGAGLLAALFAIPAVIACIVILLALVRRRPSGLWLIAGIAIYGLSLAYASAVLSLGH